MTRCSQRHPLGTASSPLSVCPVSVNTCTQYSPFTDLAFNGIFTVEMVVRMVARGPLGYVREPWNVFDGAMVLVGYTSLMQNGEGSGSTSSFRALRALRALRPLRTITRFQSLRSVVVCFLEVPVSSLMPRATERAHCLGRPSAGICGRYALFLPLPFRHRRSASLRRCLPQSMLR